MWMEYGNILVKLYCWWFLSCNNNNNESQHSNQLQLFGGAYLRSLYWQGMDDKVAPPSMTDFVHRILPGAAVHKLPYEGHFTYIYFCVECHRQIFTTLFGTPQGPINMTTEVVPSPLQVDTEEQEEMTLDNSVLAQAETWLSSSIVQRRTVYRS